MNNDILIRAIDNIENVIFGKRPVIENIIIALISGGHILIEDVPGVGKTVLIKALAKTIDCSFARIQFTPDLLPSDILGVTIYNEKLNQFEFKAGPIFNQIILADEINRTSPKTQSSLLEAMEEHQITVDGKTYKLDEPFMVLATQNPIEYEGTFPLPEAQLDRFFMKISIGYPDEDNEILMMRKYRISNRLEELSLVLTPEQIKEIRELVKNIYVNDKIEKYILSIISETRKDSEILLGASPRATLNLLRSSQAKAFLRNRKFVTPDDVKSVAVNILSHRLLLKSEIKYKGKTAEKKVEEIISNIKVPGVGIDV
ncbi:ATPase family associated with various cellular activities (AAA) [Caloramator mitchellensis]|uniref:ATPase family associated with various cellular activities (AAA) n=1 Tax=Caloramator mitchellensis TaxID=908809 RepID=A0A0R3JWT8_CALMK|nr:MoxR family ATPase [Caloramator mitchellensis]KRQ88007.1 ATPase family associated with various cellular activities (AAA) [Caloramator mitchellensis]